MSFEIKRGRGRAPLNLTPDNRSLASKRQKENRANPTPAEAHVMKLLDELGEQYIFEKIFLTTRRFYLVDFYLPKPRRIALEIDGESHDRTKAYDLERDNYLTTQRYVRRMVRISNETALSLNAEELILVIS